MYFTLAVSAATAGTCAALTAAARDADPRIMPLPGPARVAWQAPDGRAAILHWGQPGDGSSAGRSQAGSIWAEAGTVRSCTGLTRVDPVYRADAPGAVVLSDRASWAAAATGRLRDIDPTLAGAFLSLGYPVGGVTPFRGVRALRGGQIVRVAGGRLRARDDGAGTRYEERGTGPDRVAAALTDAVRPLGDVELSLTGGKDSRLVAAALVAAGVPFRARTHGFAGHPDVIVARMIAGRLELEHTVTEPAAPGTPGPRRGTRPYPGDRARLRRDAVRVRERRTAGPAGRERPGAGRGSRRGAAARRLRPARLGTPVERRGRG